MENLNLTVKGDCVYSKFFEKSKALEPKLYERKVSAIRIGHTEPDESWDGYRFVEDTYPLSFQKGDCFCLDFGEHSRSEGAGGAR